MTKLLEWWKWFIKWIRCLGCGHKYFPDEYYTIGSNVNQICGYCGKIKLRKGFDV